MGGTSTSQQQQTQQSSTQPWTPAQPLLNNILGQLNGISISPTAGQTGAANDLVSASTGLPNYAPQAEGVTDNLLSGGPDYSGYLTSALGGLQNNIGGIASSNPDPMSDPGVRQLIDTTNSDTTNAINGQFAAAGRDLSPANSTALARGLSQGEAGILTNQYNTDVANKQAAAGTLYGAGTTTGTGLQGLTEAQLGNQVQGLGAASTVPQLATLPGQTELAATTTQAQLPASIAGYLEQLGIPIASLGSESTGTGTTTGSQTMSGAQQFALLGQGAGGFGKLLFG